MRLRRGTVRATSLAGLGCVAVVLVTLAMAQPASAASASIEPGGRLTRVVTGFAAHTAVSQRLIGQAGTTTLYSDAHGAVDVSYRVPRKAGHYRLTLVGRPPGQAPAGAAALAAGHRARAVITVAVPKLSVIPFAVVRPHSGSGGSGTGGTGNGGTGTGGTGTGGVHTGSGGTGDVHTGSGGTGDVHTGSGGTADTGVDVQSLLEMAGLALAGGLVAAGAGYRPRRRAW